MLDIVESTISQWSLVIVGGLLVIVVMFSLVFICYKQQKKGKQELPKSGIYNLRRIMLQQLSLSYN